MFLSKNLSKATNSRFYIVHIIRKGVKKSIHFKLLYKIDFPVICIISDTNDQLVCLKFLKFTFLLSSSILVRKRLFYLQFLPSISNIPHINLSATVFTFCSSSFYNFFVEWRRLFHSFNNYTAFANMFSDECHIFVPFKPFKPCSLHTEQIIPSFYPFWRYFGLVLQNNKQLWSNQVFASLLMSYWLMYQQNYYYIEIF